MSDFDLIDSATGQPTRVSAEEAQRGLASGALRAGRALRLRHTSGRVAVVQPEGVARALSGSFRLDTPEDEERRTRQREHPIQSQVVEPVVTTAASALRGPTLGTSRVLEHGLGIGEDIERMREENPTAAAIGDVGGIALSIPEGGGAGLLRGTEAAGAAATRAIAPAGAALGRRVIGSAVGSGVEAGLQGAMMQGGEILTEEALGEDPGDIAERMITSGGLASLLGVGLGTSGRLLREGRAAAGRSTRDMASLLSRSFEQRTGRALDDSVASALADRLAGASSLASGAPRDAIRELASPGAERIVLRGQDALEQGSRRLTSHMDHAERAYDAVREAITGANKAESVERLMGGDLGVQLQRAEEQIGAARRMADDLDHQVRVYAGGDYGPRAPGVLRPLRGAVERAEDRIAALRARRGAGSQADQAEAFVALDQLRRDLGGFTERLGMGERGPMYEQFMATRAGLEDAGIWGADAAALQRETNAAWHPLIAASGPFEQRFLTDAGLASGFRTSREADSARVRAYLDGLGTARSETAETVWSRRYEAMQALNDAALARHSLSPAERSAALSLRDSLAALRRTHGEIATDATRLRQWQEIMGASSSGAGGLTGLVGAGALGAGMGAIGAPLLVASQLANPARGIRILQTLRRLSRQTDTRILSSVRGFLGRGARRVADWGSTAAAAGRRGARRGAAAYAERVAELDRHTDPQQLIRRISDSTAELTHAAPQTQAALGHAAARAVAYLQAQRPRGRVLPGDMRHEPRPPSIEEMDRFLRIARAVDDPGSVLDDLRSRRLTPEAIDAVRAVYPALYRQIVATVMREMAEGEHRPSYQDRLQLGVLLGIPTDPSLAPESLRILQQAHEAASAANPQAASGGASRGGSGGAPDLSRGLAGASDRTEERRAAV